MEGGVWPNRHITCIVAKKLNLQFILLYLRYMWGEGVGWKRHIWRGGVGRKRQNTVIWGKGSKIAQKLSYDIWMLPKGDAVTRAGVSAKIFETTRNVPRPRLWAISQTYIYSPILKANLSWTQKTVELEWCKKIYHLCLYLSVFILKNFRYSSLSFYVGLFINCLYVGRN